MSGLEPLIPLLTHPGTIGALAGFAVGGFLLAKPIKIAFSIFGPAVIKEVAVPATGVAVFDVFCIAVAACALLVIGLWWKGWLPPLNRGDGDNKLVT